MHDAGVVRRAFRPEKDFRSGDHKGVGKFFYVVEKVTDNKSTFFLSTISFVVFLGGNHTAMCSCL